MSTLENVNDSPTGQHTHAPSLATGEATERCPWCGQPIDRSEYTRITKEIEARERARLEKAEKTLRERFEREAKSQAEKVRRDAAKAAEEQIKALKANQEKIINQRLQAQSAAFEKAKSAALKSEKEKHFRERLHLDQQLAELQKKLQQQTANQLGDAAELDLFSGLKHDFPTDQIERVKKGKSGGDIVHRVIYNGQSCGSILFESKNTSRFMSKYISKLRNDQTSEQADHAVLVTSAFPSGARHLDLREGVLIVSPGLVIPVVHLLRRQILQAHGLRLSNEGRREQRDALYEFVVSNAAAQLWGQFTTLTEDMRQLDQSEMERHRRVWAKRADLITSLVGLHDRLSDSVSKIIGVTESEAS